MKKNEMTLLYKVVSCKIVLLRKYFNHGLKQLISKIIFQIKIPFHALNIMLN